MIDRLEGAVEALNQDDPARWSATGSRPHEEYVVLTIRDGQIADMQSCRSRRVAKRFARRHGSGT
jgi:hypothetical protein